MFSDLPIKVKKSTSRYGKKCEIKVVRKSFTNRMNKVIFDF